MFDFIVNVLLQAIIESIPKFLGAFVRWCFFFGQKKFSIVFEEEWNKRIGLLIIIIMVVLII
ncbi:MAG: hypothetical protein ACPGUH_07810 [Winogradskyella sp.]